MNDNHTKWLFEEWDSLADLKAHAAAQRVRNEKEPSILPSLLSVTPEFIITQD